MKLLPVIGFLVAFGVSAGLCVEWESYTYSNDLFDVHASDSAVLCATGGGLLEFDPVSETFLKYTNVDGLLECPCSAVDVDDMGNWWIAHSSKGVTVRSPDGRTTGFTRYEGIPGDTLCCISVMGDLVMVGTDDGVWSVDTHGDPFEPPLSYSLYLGNRLLRAISVSDSVVWYCTDAGLYGAHKSTPADTIHHYTAADGLPANSVSGVADGPELWVGTDDGPAVYRDTTWVQMDSGLSSVEVRDLVFSGDTLWAATGDGVGFFRDSVWTMRNSGLPSSDVTSLASDSTSFLWCGTVRGGLGRYDGTWKRYRSDGLLWNELEGVETWGDDVWVVYGKSGYGVSRLRQGEWQHFTRDTFPELRHSMKTVRCDSEGNVWLGTWLGGLIQGTPSGEWYVYTDTNGFLPSKYVSALDIDYSDNKWVASYYAGGDYGITVLSSDNTRRELYAQSTLLVIVGIAIDSTDQRDKWFGSFDSGLHVLSDGGTPFDQSDDTWRSYQEPELPSDEIRALTVDKDGDVWVSTTGGVARIRAGTVVEYYYASSGGLPSSLVYQMVPDWEGGVWLEHEYGVTRANPDGTWTNYTSSDGLVSDKITYLYSGLAYDTDEGILFVGTGGGLSRLDTELLPHASLDSIDVYPNPFIPSAGHLRVTFRNVPDGLVVRIYTMSGELVKEIDQVLNTFAYWDGRNSKGEEVASGVYLFAIGRNTRGVIALVR